MENEERVVLLAEEVTIDKKRSNDIFLLITFKLCDNQGNLNREGVTAAFISEIINNADKYAALPLYVDVPELLSKNYRNLTHRYDPETGRFNTDQIGGIVHFYSEMNNVGIVSQYGEARVPKREIDICERIQEQYELGLLNVSFEVKYDPNNTIVKDGVRFVDAGEGNTLTGMAIVSVPACPDANALEMVAEANEQADVNEVNKEMPKEEIVMAENEEVKTEESVTAEAKTEEEKKEEVTAEISEENSDSETATAETAEAEVVHESIEIRESVNYDDYDGKTYHAVTTEHTVVETVDPEPQNAQEPVMAEDKATSNTDAQDDRDLVIAQLKERIAALELAEAELNKIKEAQALAEHQAKQEKAKVFAENQGLDITDENVANAIANLDYEAIADLAMANVNSQNKTEKPEITMASYVDMEVSGEYGDLLARR